MRKAKFFGVICNTVLRKEQGEETIFQDPQRICDIDCDGSFNYPAVCDGKRI